MAEVAAALVEDPQRAAMAARQATNLRLLQGVARLVHGNAQRTYHYILRLDGVTPPDQWPLKFLTDASTVATRPVRARSRSSPNLPEAYTVSLQIIQE